MRKPVQAKQTNICTLVERNTTRSNWTLHVILPFGGVGVVFAIPGVFKLCAKDGLKDTKNNNMCLGMFNSHVAVRVQWYSLHNKPIQGPRNP
eukprot:3718211-Amphidinium_carterae.1